MKARIDFLKESVRARMRPSSCPSASDSAALVSFIASLRTVIQTAACVLSNVVATNKMAVTRNFELKRLSKGCSGVGEKPPKPESYPLDQTAYVEYVTDSGYRLNRTAGVFSSIGIGPDFLLVGEPKFAKFDQRGVTRYQLIGPCIVGVGGLLR